MILPTLLPWVMAALALALALNAWRLFRGPALTDRILALDTLYINGLALVFACIGKASLHELLVVLFLFITAPVSAHLLVKAALKSDPAARPVPAKGLDLPAESSVRVD